MDGQIQKLSIEKVQASKWNPRKTFDGAGMKELTESIKRIGVTSPLLVRKSKANGHYEVASGHRRLIAAEKAGLAEIPVIVRELSDEEFLDILTIENLQREDVSPMEEAHGYKRMLHGGQSVASVAQRVSKSEAYIYDRLLLLDLVKDAQDAVDEGKLPIGHAILLARLKPKDQKRAITRPEKGGGFVGGVFQMEAQSRMAGTKDAPLKPVSLAELKVWIDEKVRFDKTSVDSFLFPEAAKEIAKAKEKSLSVVPITFDYMVPPDAKDEKERTYTLRSWHQADGKENVKPFEKKKPTKTCEKSVLGVIVVGQGRGTTLTVCVDRTCKIHFPPKAKQKVNLSKAKEEAKYAEEQAKRAAEDRRRHEAAEHWRAAVPAITTALEEAFTKAETTLEGRLGQFFGYKGKEKGNAEDLVRWLALGELGQMIARWDAIQVVPKVAKAFGVDTKAILKATPKPEPKAEPDDQTAEGTGEDDGE